MNLFKVMARITVVSQDRLVGNQDLIFFKTDIKIKTSIFLRTVFQDQELNQATPKPAKTLPCIKMTYLREYSTLLTY